VMDDRRKETWRKGPLPAYEINLPRHFPWT
jgi:hypothetical protein